eukprot:UC1_evm1s865
MLEQLTKPDESSHVLALTSSADASAMALKENEEVEEEGDEAVAAVAVVDGEMLVVDAEEGAAVTARKSLVPDGTALLTAQQEADARAAPPRLLRKPVRCYVCKRAFRRLHFFYDQLCPNCAEFNYTKRSLRADLSGRVCLVTGGRVKIGYRCALILLECGATVVVTSRFPVNAARRFAAEAGFAEWGHRLQVCGIDFRDLQAVERFCVMLSNDFDRLDCIVNNA